MNDPYLASWYRAFVITFAVEAPLVLLLTRESALGVARRLVLAFLAQTMTHPLLWFVFTATPGLSFAVGAAIGEAWAWLGEALLYWASKLEPRPLRALAVSGVANGVSYALGLLLDRLR